MATHEHLRPRVLAYGGQSTGDASLMELASTYLPILLVLTVACVNVGTLVYARTATRDAEIAMRFALGASRGRIVSQLFVEALVLSAVAAAVGLLAAQVTLAWATTPTWILWPRTNTRNCSSFSSSSSGCGGSCARPSRKGRR